MNKEPDRCDVRRPEEEPLQLGTGPAGPDVADTWNLGERSTDKKVQSKALLR